MRGLSIIRPGPLKRRTKEETGSGVLPLPVSFLRDAFNY